MALRQPSWTRTHAWAYERVHKTLPVAEESQRVGAGDPDRLFAVDGRRRQQVAGRQWTRRAGTVLGTRGHSASFLLLLARRERSSQ